MKPYLLIFLAVLFGSSLVLAQAPPIDNPYKSRYNTIGHWTDSLHWNWVYNATDHNVYPNDGSTDDEYLDTLMLQVEAAGGGVIYFPPGEYNFTKSIGIPNGVILRGADPVGITDARVDGYKPPTRFEFPKYEFDSLANNGNGVDNSTAFKNIRSRNGMVNNAGVVNIDINRAGIGFGPSMGTVPGFSTPQPLYKNVNIIVFGTRTNNVGSPSSDVPASFQRKWQRFMYTFSRNIGVFVYRNTVVANNRCNDIRGMGGQDDSFEQEGYIVRRNPTSRGFDTLSGPKAVFDYCNHYGINVCRKSAVTGASPEQEPGLFAEGIEVLDNYIFKTMRVGLICAGLNAVIKGNVIRDQMNKVTWLHPLGMDVPKNANTFENRAIDISGWGTRVDSNDIVVYRHRVNSGPYYSVDGEGILFQACCGGTTVNGYNVTNNTTNGAFISIFFSGDMNNCHITNNNMGGALKGGVQSGSTVWLAADVSSTQPAYLNNVTADGNYNIDNNGENGFIVTGSKGGYNCFVRDNVVVPNPTQSSGIPMRISCHVVQQNNVGFSAIIIENNNGNPCGPPSGLATVTLTSPSADSVFCPDTAAGPMTLSAKVHNSPDIATATVNLYVGNTIIGANLVPNQDSVVSTQWMVPTTVGQFTITSIVNQSGILSFSESVRLSKNCQIDTMPALDVHNRILPPDYARMYPNPVNAGETATATSVFKGHILATVYDNKGSIVFNEEQETLPDGSIKLNTGNLSPGLYMLGISQGQARKTWRLVVK